MPFIDFHCDTASLLSDTHGLCGNDGMLSLEKLRRADVFCQFFAMYIRMNDYAGPDEGFARIESMYHRFVEEVAANSDQIALVTSATEVDACRETGRIAAVLTVEEGGVCGEKPERLEALYRMGVRLITLTWNFENSLGYANSDNPAVMQKGLKPFGREIVERMDQLGMIVDVSHLSDGGFWDVAEICKGPFVASHSNARSVCNHRRNLTDDMLRTLANAGGITGINFFHRFLGDDETGSMDQMLAHIRHIHQVAGIDVLALGSDFDGFEGPCELSGSDELPVLADALSRSGFSDDEIEKICWKNAMRVIHDLL